MVISTNNNNLITVRHLSKTYSSGFLWTIKKVLAVDDVSFNIPEKPLILALVGESGSGKSTIAKLLLDLINPSSGEVLYRNKNITKLNKKEYKMYRREVQGIFQDPYSAVNPLRKVDYIFKILIKKISGTKEEGRNLVNSVLADVGIEKSFLNKYPHQMSGGELQRIMIARAFVLKPKVIVADELVSMLDASLRATILKIILDVKEKYNMSFIYITHDLSTAYYLADKVIVLYQGGIVEYGSHNIIVNPNHPYTKLLSRSIPRPDPSITWEDRVDLSKIELGATNVIGCKFYDRCSKAIDRCTRSMPPLVEVGQEHLVACFFPHSARAIE